MKDCSLAASLKSGEKQMQLFCHSNLRTEKTKNKEGHKEDKENSSSVAVHQFHAEELDGLTRPSFRSHGGVSEAGARLS